jgi:RimJ/RimL family protein N-acetyltransferase
MECAMNTDLHHWTARKRPERSTLQGRHVRLEPLSAVVHGDALYAAATDKAADQRFRWLFETRPATRAAFDLWLEQSEASADPLFFAVVDQQNGEAVGRQTLMRIDPGHGVIETGNIHWGPKMQRTPRATEALYLHARHVFDNLGYRRFEWKCNNANLPSRAAALRFGFTFEGVFRNHMVVKGENRDTAWFAMIDTDWPKLKQAFELWLEPANFAADGQQLRRLEDIREQVNGRQA